MYIYIYIYMRACTCALMPINNLIKTGSSEVGHSGGAKSSSEGTAQLRVLSELRAESQATTVGLMGLIADSGQGQEDERPCIC